MEKILNYIDGEWIESTAVNFIEVINPATGEHLEQTPLSLRSNVDACIQAAHAAFPGWRRTPAVERVQYLFKLKVLMEDNLDDLARTITQECGKTYEEAVAEMRRAIENVERACGIPILAQGTIAEDIAPGYRRDHDPPAGGCSSCDLPVQFPGDDSVLVHALWIGVRQYLYRQTVRKGAPDDAEDLRIG